MGTKAVGGRRGEEGEAGIKDKRRGGGKERGKSKRRGKKEE